MPFCATWEEAATAAGAVLDGPVDPRSKTYGSLKYECGGTVDEFYLSYFPVSDTTCATSPMAEANRVRFAMDTCAAHTHPPSRARVPTRSRTLQSIRVP